MKLFASEGIRKIDSLTIDMEPVKSLDLMERAASAVLNWFVANIERSEKIVVFAGPGNNGGDGLALTRLLLSNRYDAEVYIVGKDSSKSEDFKINLARLSSLGGNIVYEISSKADIPLIPSDRLIIDALFGTGLDRPVKGIYKELIRSINRYGCRVVSVDIPSGLFSEDNSTNLGGTIIRAHNTLSFQFPKIAFMFPENEDYVGKLEVLPIGLHPLAIKNEVSRFYITDGDYLRRVIHRRRIFDHKGKFGHGLVVAGSCGKAGAAVLTAKAALRSGIGLLTAHVSKPVGDIIHCSLPEAMVQCDQSDILVSEVYNLNSYNAICIGPGIGTKPNTVKAVSELLKNWGGALVLDADALNIVSQNRELLGILPVGTILTPHPGEFSRLAGEFEDSYSRLMVQSELSSQTNAIIVLKGAFTSITLPGGDIWFNPTGNPGMASAGSGDVLSGILLSLLAQGYTSAEAAIVGVYIHGLAGDIAAGINGYEALIASDIIDNIGNAFKELSKNI